MCRPTSIIVRASEIRAAQGQLLGNEPQLLDGAVSRRQHEIIGGRVLARRAMVELGYPAQAVGQQPNGAPIWPSGLCGSIAHSHVDVVVALASSAEIRSVGIDIDDGRNLGAAIHQAGRPEEVQALLAHPLAGDNEGAARLLFSAKEALFKCQSPVTHNDSLGLRDVRLRSSTGGCITAVAEAVVDNDVAAIVANIRIIIEIIQGVTIALAWIEME